MHIRWKDGIIYLDQTAYLQKVLQRFDLLNAKATATPLPEGYQPSPNTSTASPALRSEFQQVIGSLLYIMLGTRPDIAFAVTKLSQHAANPTEEHLSKALYICRYLLGSANYAMVLNGPSNGGLMAYADSDWASDPNTRKSTTGYLVKLAGAVFSWSSRAQKTIALSSTEAEYMSLSVTTFPPFCSHMPITDYLPLSCSHSRFRQPRHSPFHCHISLHYHLPTWPSLFILISDSDSLRLPSYLLISDTLYDTKTRCGRPFPGLSCI